MPVFGTNSRENTIALGEKLGKTLNPGQLVVFTGGLGVGKTCFCTGLAKGLGCVDAVSSPTYAIVNVYRGRVQFAHFDAYRIETGEDLETAGFYDLLESGAVVAVEWSENVAYLLPKADYSIDISVLPNGSRCIQIEGAGAQNL